MRTQTLYCEDCQCDVEVLDIGHDKLDGLDVEDRVHVREGHDLSEPGWEDETERRER